MTGATDGSAALIAPRISRRAASASPAARTTSVPPIARDRSAAAGRYRSSGSSTDTRVDDVLHHAHDFDDVGRLSVLVERHGDATADGIAAVGELPRERLADEPDGRRTPVDRRR